VGGFQTTAPGRGRSIPPFAERREVVDYDPKSLHLFAHGTWDEGDRRYDDLYRAYKIDPWMDRKPRPRYVTLVASPHSARKCPMRARTGTCTCFAQWAVLEATSERSGVVAWSNLPALPPGMRVRTRACWYYLKKRRGEGSVETVGTPISLVERYALAA
jgi:hypothetical protein